MGCYLFSRQVCAAVWAYIAGSVTEVLTAGCVEIRLLASSRIAAAVAALVTASPDETPPDVPPDALAPLLLDELPLLPG